jgi:DNA-binding Lrp family transcriptional regulator
MSLLDQLSLLPTSLKPLASEACLQLTTAYVLAKVEAGKDEDVLKEVKRIAGVQHAAPTYGMYDLHVEVSFNTMDELDKFVFDKVRRISGIKETVTLIAFKKGHK